MPSTGGSGEYGGDDVNGSSGTGSGASGGLSNQAAGDLASALGIGYVGAIGQAGKSASTASDSYGQATNASGSLSGLDPSTANAALAAIAKANPENPALLNAIFKEYAKSLSFMEEQAARKSFNKSQISPAVTTAMSMLGLPVGPVTELAMALNTMTNKGLISEEQTSTQSEPSKSGNNADENENKSLLSASARVADKTESGTEETEQEEAGLSSKFWDEFVAKWLEDENNASLLFQDSADHMADAAQKNTDTINAATEDQDGYLDSIVERYAKPVSFEIGGDTVSFVPKGSRNTISSLGDVGQTKLDNISVASTNELENAQITDPTVGQRSYLDALYKILDKENSRNSQITDAAYKAALADMGYIDLDQREPGVLDYLGSIVDIGNGLFGSNGLFG